MPKRFYKKPITSFREKVCEVVRRIPRGKFLSYREVARVSGRSKAWRAVGNILNKNKSAKIPCHRVVRSDGKIGGYRYGMNKKTSLLKKEGVLIKKRG